MTFTEWPALHTHILQLEQQGFVTRTFRRLDPDRQQTVIDAILEEAIEKGPASLNIKEVARRAGVSVGSLYTYFPNRDTLLNFAVELCVRYITDQFGSYRSFLVEMPLREALAAYVMGGIEWGKAQVGLMQFFTRAAYQGDSQLGESVVRPIAALIREITRDMLAAGIERGEVRPDIDLEATSRAVNGLIIAIGDSQLLPYLNTYFQVTDDDVSPERVLNAALDVILRGIGNER